MSSQAIAAYMPSFGRNDVQVLAGTFDDFSFTEVVQVMGLSRQCFRFLIGKNGVVWSEILVKAGRVLSANALAEREPQQVFRMLVEASVKGSGLSFSIFHIEPTGPYPAPIGELALLCKTVSADTDTLTTAVAAPQTAPSSFTSTAAARTHARPRADSDTLVIERSAFTRMMAGASSAAPLSDIPSLRRSNEGFPTASGLASPTEPPTPPAVSMTVDLYALLAQRLEQISGQMHALDARIQGLPQLLNVEMRLALAQIAPPPAPTPTPAPVPAPVPAPQASTRMSGVWQGALIGVLATVCILLLLLRQ